MTGPDDPARTAEFNLPTDKVDTAEIARAVFGSAIDTAGLAAEARPLIEAALTTLADNMIEALKLGYRRGWTDATDAMLRTLDPGVDPDAT